MGLRVQQFKHGQSNPTYLLQVRHLEIPAPPMPMCIKADHGTKYDESMHKCSAERAQEVCAAQEASWKGAGISACSGKGVSGEAIPTRESCASRV